MNSSNSSNLTAEASNNTGSNSAKMALTIPLFNARLAPFNTESSCPCTSIFRSPIVVIFLAVTKSSKVTYVTDIGFTFGFPFWPVRIEADFLVIAALSARQGTCNVTSPASSDTAASNRVANIGKSFGTSKSITPDFSDALHNTVFRRRPGSRGNEARTAARNLQSTRRGQDDGSL